MATTILRCTGPTGSASSLLPMSIGADDGAAGTRAGVSRVMVVAMAIAPGLGADAYADPDESDPAELDP